LEKKNLYSGDHVISKMEENCFVFTTNYGCGILKKCDKNAISEMPTLPDESLALLSFENYRES